MEPGGQDAAGVLAAARARLVAAGLPAEEAARDARLLLAHALERDAAGLLALGAAPLPAEALARFEAALARRAAREPASRIIARRAFHDVLLEVAPHVLDPRPDTEVLVEALLEAVRAGRLPARLRLLDIGTGSGAIAIACLAALAQAQAVATDLAPAALELAARNARANGVADRLHLVQADLFPPRGQAISAPPFEAILSNPPYIESAAIEALAPEVRAHDPRLALDGGADGLAVIARILAGARGALASGGLLGLEIGAGQDEALASLAEGEGWRVRSRHHDLAGHCRAMLLERAAPSL